MHFVIKSFAFAALALGAFVASDAAAEEPVDVATVKPIIQAKIRSATKAAEANCPGRKDAYGKMGKHGGVRFKLHVSHEGHTAPAEILMGGGATLQCVVGYFTFTHPPYKGADYDFEYGVQLSPPPGVKS
jgi:hypothetical protein